MVSSRAGIVQEIYIREYVPLITYAKGIADLPITKEFRIFVYKEQVLTGGFYWSSWGDTCLEADPKWVAPEWTEIPWSFLSLVLTKINAPFYAVNIAQDDTGRWWVVDLNDGQMSGLSGNDPKQLYFHLFNMLKSPLIAGGLPERLEGGVHRTDGLRTQDDGVHGVESLVNRRLSLGERWRLRRCRSGRRR